MVAWGPKPPSTPMVFTYPSVDDSPLLTAEGILRDARRGKDEVARGLELPAQAAQIDAEQPALPLAHFARDDHRLDVRAIHQRHHRAGHVVDRRYIDRLCVEDNDVGLLARSERASLAAEPQGLGAIDRGVTQHIARRERGRNAGGWRWPIR